MRCRSKYEIRSLTPLTPEPIRTAIYAPFRNHSVLRSDGTQLTYWKDGERGESSASEILASNSGNGNCNAWSDLFIYSLLLQGIPAESVTISPPAGQDGLLMVKRWTFVGSGSGEGEYPFIESPAESIVEINDIDGIPAHGNANPPGAFKIHIIAQSDGRFYDPSYGSPVSGTPDGHESWAFDGFKVKVFDSQNQLNHYRAKKNDPGLDATYD